MPTKVDPFQERPQNYLRLTVQRLFEEAHSAGGGPGAPGNASHLFDEALAQDATKAVAGRPTPSHSSSISAVVKRGGANILRPPLRVTISVLPSNH